MTSRADLINRLTKDSKKATGIPLFDFDQLRHPGLRMLIPDQVIQNICGVVADMKLDTADGKKKRRQYFKEQLAPYGFVRLGGGTNREVYKHLDDTSVVLKIAIDSLARNNNLAEIVKQEWIKPFCTKMFDVSTCGTLGLMERGDPIVNRIQRLNAADGIYRVMEICNEKGYVVGDGGADFFMNYVIRPGFGPVLCDFTSVYKLDFAKLRCRRFNPQTGKMCGGAIDYQLPAMSKIVCEKCGAVYSALDLAKEVETMEQLIHLVRSDETMEVKIIKNGVVLKHTKKSTDTIKHEAFAKNERIDLGDEVSVKLSFTEKKDDGTIIRHEVVDGVDNPNVQYPNAIKVDLQKEEDDNPKVRVVLPGESTPSIEPTPEPAVQAPPKKIKVNLREGEYESALEAEAKPEVETPKYVTVEERVSIKPQTVVEEEPVVEEKEPVRLQVNMNETGYGIPDRPVQKEVVGTPNNEELSEPEPTSNEVLHELVEQVREELKASEEEIESKITINGKPVDFSQFEEESSTDKEITEETDKWEQEYPTDQWDSRPTPIRKPKQKMALDQF